MDPLLKAADGPSGQSFSISDLMIAQGWADYHELILTVELDHCIEGVEYEEVLAFYRHGVRRWAMWRSDAQVVVAGQRRVMWKIESLPDALEAIGARAADAPARGARLVR